MTATASPDLARTKTAAEWAHAARRSTNPNEAKVFAWYAAAADHTARGAYAVNPFCPETEKDLREQWWWFFGLRCKASRKEAVQVAKAGPRASFTKRPPAGRCVRTESSAYAELMGGGV